MLISPATGLPLVFAGDRTDLDTLKSIACLNTDCSSSSTAALTTTAQPTQRPTAAVGPDGQVTLAWIGLYKDGEPLCVGRGAACCGRGHTSVGPSFLCWLACTILTLVLGYATVS